MKDLIKREREREIYRRFFENKHSYDFWDIRMDGQSGL